MVEQRACRAGPLHKAASKTKAAQACHDNIIPCASMAYSGVGCQTPTGIGLADPTDFRLAMALVHSCSLTARNHSVDMALARPHKLHCAMWLEPRLVDATGPSHQDFKAQHCFTHFHSDRKNDQIIASAAAYIQNMSSCGQLQMHQFTSRLLDECCIRWIPCICTPISHLSLILEVQTFRVRHLRNKHVARVESL